MANQNQLICIRRGVNAWNEWRRAHTGLRPNLRAADLSGANLSGAILSDADLEGANLTYANLTGADLSNVFIQNAVLIETNLTGANLTGANAADVQFNRAILYRAIADSAFLDSANFLLANLTAASLLGANLRRADLTGANCTGAKLAGANLEGVRLVETNLSGADVTGCRVYGTSAWNVIVDEDTKQTDLVITRFQDQRFEMMSAAEPVLHVDRLEIAQFIYPLLNDPKLRDVIETVGRKAVLILGRFTPDRKEVLDAIRDALRQRDYLPILFDFQGPNNRDTQETVMTLAHLSRFIIADITEPRSIPQELTTIVSNLLSVPVQPILLAGNKPWGMYDRIRRSQSVLPLHEYRDLADLVAGLEDRVIAPAEEKAESVTRINL